MTRFARRLPVYFFEEPVFIDGNSRAEVVDRGNNVFSVIPHISFIDRDEGRTTEIQKQILENAISTRDLGNFLLWFYAPMAMEFAGHLSAPVTVFDCMDELSAFKFAPPELIENEKHVLAKADLVFTGGHSLYEAKKDRHPNVFPFPSSIDVEHFGRGRSGLAEPEDQAAIGGPKLGFCGVIDERFDTSLLREMAALRPEWQFVMIGPVVKIGEDDLPKAKNIHYLGGKDYKDLPAYLSGWNIAIMPFAINDATRFISPTKTPEYLAAGKPVISTLIRDVVRPYGENGLVEIASTAEEFVAAAERLLERPTSDWLSRVDSFLSDISWDKTWAEMADIIDAETSKDKGRSRGEAAVSGS